MADTDVYGSTFIRHLSLMVEMTDGVRLATDVFVPTTERLRGTIVERTPYGRLPDPSRKALKDSFYRYIEHLCLNGYSVLVQDCRGTGESEGAFAKYVNEARDGADTLAWGAAQPWWGSGAYLTGRSYSAHAALGSAVGGADGVLGMFLDCGGFWSAYHESFRHGGALELKQVTWVIDAARREARDAGDHQLFTALESQDLSHWLRRLPWRHGQSPLRFWPERERELLDLWNQEEYTDYWAQPSLSARRRAAQLDPFPSLHLSGWYDIYPVSTVNLFQEMNGRPGGDAYMILGPWTHCAVDEAVAGDVDFGESATLEGLMGADYLAVRTRWFNYCAQPTAHPFSPRVRFFLMGGGSGRKVRGRLDHGGRWLQTSEWPPPDLETVVWHLGTRGDLLEVSEPEASIVEYLYDPNEPVPSIGGSTGSYPAVLSPGAFDQREDPRFFGCSSPYLPLLARRDVLAFSTPPLATAVNVAGSVVLDLEFVTDAIDTDLTVKLIDYYPPSEQHPEGFAMNVSDTILRLRCQEGLQPVREEDGRHHYALEVTLPPTANRFAASHSVRVDLSSSNFPRFDVNSNTGVRGAHGGRRVTATNGVVAGGAHGATLRLPVLREEVVRQMTVPQAKRRTPDLALISDS